MYYPLILICVLSVVLTSFGRDINSRNVFRSGGEGAVNLVEFNLMGTIVGKCGYRSNMEELTILYEEKEGKIIAETVNPTILDPKSKVEECREAALNKPVPSASYRSGLDPMMEGENPEEIYRRFVEFEREVASNQQYIEYLRPRFITLLSALSGSQNYGISFGSLWNSSYYPSFGFALPTNVASSASVGLGFPFKTSFGKK